MSRLDERIRLTVELAEHGLPAEDWCTLDELRRKLSAARAMDIQIETVENKYF